MTIPRFFIDSQYIDEKQSSIALTDAKLIKQIRKVLRLENGSPLHILDGKGNLYHCLLQVAAADQHCLTAAIQKKEISLTPAHTKLTIALPLIKINRFEWAIEKLTELGVDTIAPVALERSVIKLTNNDFSEDKAKFIRWQKIIQEATEQCERPIPPQLSIPIPFNSWLEKLPNEHNTLRMVCTERRHVQSLENLLYNQKELPDTCAIAFGAEGGFVEEEIKLALSHEFIPVSLGPNILRTETATIYTLAIVNAFLRSIQKDPQL